MIITPIKLYAYRVLTPQWSYLPHSGAGAAKVGGRFNRQGQQAVYLALEPETALSEFAQAEPVFGPGTIATYRVELRRVADFSKGYSDQWDELWKDWDCEWKKLFFMEDIEPPTWLMSDVVSSMASGLLFPSTKRPGGTNLVVFLDSLAEADVFNVHDPEGALPKTSASWDIKI
ncbi:RES family NAD+ phosphorylase [Pseudoxanthomonas japonensis]|uniref:RES family NAD+ phosphorylase n=1 Tax=Pseudoxanthomonas japonensis TaxID=69284 RepID=UPI003748E708